MPRKSTAAARQSRADLLRLLAELPPDTPLPPVRELGARHRLHASTMFRMLRDLAVEGKVWQDPAGRFHPVTARKRNLKGAPICFLGRDMWRWSRLYQEILEGVAEVCAANVSPLILMSAPILVRQKSATSAPVFASALQQRKALADLLAAVPRGCAGFLLDHLWGDAALEANHFPAGARIQLLAGSGRTAGVIAPDYAHGARLVRKHMSAKGIAEVWLAKSFAGDPAIEAGMAAVRVALGDIPLREFRPSAFRSDFRRPGRNSARPGQSWVLCPEDNTARQMEAHWTGGRESSPRPALIALQGTGLLVAPFARLRYDYRRLGRGCAAQILHGTRFSMPKPILIDGANA